MSWPRPTAPQPSVPLLPYLAVVAVGLFFFFRKNSRSEGDARRQVRIVVLCAIVSLSHFLAAVPYGILVSIWTAFPLYVGLVIALWGLTAGAPQVVRSLFLLTLVGVPAAGITFEKLQWFAVFTKDYRDRVEQALERESAPNGGEVAIFSREFPRHYKSFVETLPVRQPLFSYSFQEPSRISPAFRELGYRVRFECPRSMRQGLRGPCLTLAEQVERSECPQASEFLCLARVTFEERRLIVLRMIGGPLARADLADLGSRR